MKKLILRGILPFAAASVILAGCGDGGSEEEPEENTEPTEETETEENSDEAAEEENDGTDADLTAQLEEEEGVVGGQVVANEESAVAAIVLDAEVSDEKANALAEDYADQLKEKYPDLPVNVQATRDGENVANINRE